MPKQTNEQTNKIQSPLDDLLIAIEAEECRRSLKEFVVNAWHIVEPSRFKDGWVVSALTEHLTALTMGQFRFLLISIPPRHSKSTICSVLWPVWCWLHRPDDRFLVASYSLDLSIRDNLRKRNLIESPWFQQRYGREFSIEAGNIRIAGVPDFTLSDNQMAKRFFTNDKLGYQLATSIGSSTTGSGGSKLVIDDPHAADEAHSDVERESAVTYFRETWSNRMNDAEKDCMLVIGQRIHSDDISGHIIKERKDWVHLNLPAEYEPDRKCYTPVISQSNDLYAWKGCDPRSVAGELLWPERFSMETLDRYKRDLGSIGYHSQYQQEPVPMGGSVFREQWMRYCSIQDDHYLLETPDGIHSVPISSCWRFTVVDLAISSKQSADYTVIQTWDVTPANELLLIDQLRDHLDNPAQQRAIKTVYLRFMPQFVQIETVAYQLSLVQQLRDTPFRGADLPQDEIDFLVDTGSPEALDRTLRSLLNDNGYLVETMPGSYQMLENGYIARVKNDFVGYFKFAVEKQGYCRIIRQLEDTSIEYGSQRISIPLKAYKPVRDKVSRASSAAILMENGKIYFLKTLPDLQEIKTELLRFPRYSHDDVVDGVSMAAEVISTPLLPLQGVEPAVEEVRVPTMTEIMQENPFDFAARLGYFND